MRYIILIMSSNTPHMSKQILTTYVFGDTFTKKDGPFLASGFKPFALNKHSVSTTGPDNISDLEYKAKSVFKMSKVSFKTKTLYI